MVLEPLVRCQLFDPTLSTFESFVRRQLFDVAIIQVDPRLRIEGARYQTLSTFESFVRCQLFDQTLSTFESFVRCQLFDVAIIQQITHCSR